MSTDTGDDDLFRFGACKIGDCDCEIAYCYEFETGWIPYKDIPTKTCDCSHKVKNHKVVCFKQPVSSMPIPV